MYLRVVKTALTEAIRNTFSEDYDVPELRGIWASIEYPIHEHDYPGIWINYEDASNLSIAGIAHRETVDPEVDPENEGREYTRWMFQGHATFTIGALSSNERDTIYDELIRVIAFGRENEQRSVFRNHIEGNDLVAMNIDFDTVEPRGDAAAPGTPWGTEQIVYERSIALQVIGEFVSDPWGGDIVPLSKIIYTAYYEGDYPDGQPQFTGQYPND